jgi:hypothetical protein
MDISTRARRDRDWKLVTGSHEMICIILLRECNWKGLASWDKLENMKTRIILRYLINQ